MAEAILVNRTRFTSSLKNELMKDFDILAQKTRIPKSRLLDEAIEDLLTAIGAPIAAMTLMNTKAEKFLRNGVNRRVNCETANLTKVVDASMGQMAAIRALEEAGELDKLPGKLRETALLRRENPEATLQELAAMLNPPITKSAINHRMRKLLELARALEE